MGHLLLIRKGYQHQNFSFSADKKFTTLFISLEMFALKGPLLKYLIWKIERRWLDNVSQYPLDYEVCAWGYPGGDNSKHWHGIIAGSYWSKTTDVFIY
ncbi:hypothetical protein CDAR_540841 [Caerostris darwini]|uniref:Uncharacterized protein n=1 Tax=Caerostris darwini TaxID=1538125 RepID=A0AAV4VIA7_9ARAC|nr:hypothetical protein CDAR_540841 [Caerostris darwini]